MGFDLEVKGEGGGGRDRVRGKFPKREPGCGGRGGGTLGHVAIVWLLARGKICYMHMGKKGEIEGRKGDKRLWGRDGHGGGRGDEEGCTCLGFIMRQYSPHSIRF